MHQALSRFSANPIFLKHAALGKLGGISSPGLKKLNLMKYAPSLNPPLKWVEDKWETKGPTRLGPVMPVQGRDTPLEKPPQFAQPETGSEPPPEPPAAPTPTPVPIVEVERRRNDLAKGGRRTYCRRVESHSILAGLRSEVDRRKHKQREGDIAEHIDLKA